MDCPDGNCAGKMKVKSDEEDVSNQSNNGIIPAKEAYMPVTKYALYYKMDHKRRGLAYIFNHKNFVECPERHGTKRDADLLTKTLTNLGFEVNTFTDLRYQEVMEHLIQAAKFDHTNYDCFLIAILTHGNETQLWAKDRAYSPREVINKFTADMCPTLAGKPKIVIFQACLGTKFDEGITLIERTEADGGGSRMLYKIPKTADFLIIHASFQGYYAFRNSEDGSFFIDVLCTELQRIGILENILTVLTIVNQRVAVEFLSNSKVKEANEKKQMPYFESSLTRLLQFQ